MSIPPHETAMEIDMDDICSTSDEEEVLFDLDEAALSALPIRLQNNMREVQRERVCRLQKTPHHHRSKNYNNEAPRSHSRPACKEQYTEKWFHNMVEKLSVAQEMDLTRRSLCESEKGARPGERDWPEFYGNWAPVMHGRDVEMGMSDGDFVQIDQGSMFKEGSESVVLKGLEDGCYGYDGRVMGNVGGQQGAHMASKSCKRSSSIMSSMRCHVRKKLQRMSRLMGM